MRRYSLVLTFLWLSGCAASRPERIAINAPALTADLQSVRSLREMSELRRRYTMRVSLTVAKALELYMPTDYAVFPEPGIDLTRNVSLDRSRTWSEALPEALRSIGIEIEFDASQKIVRLRQSHVWSISPQPKS